VKGRPCALVVDSGAVLGSPAPPGTTVIPLAIAFGEEILRDGVDITPDDFYRRLEAGDHATTSTPSAGEYLEAFENADGDEVVCLTLPKQLSAMYATANVAAQMLRESGDARPVAVIDTATAAAGLGLVARVAAEQCAQDATAHDVRGRVVDACRAVRMFGTLRTLTYLARGGHVPSIAASVATMLDVRPVLELRGGEVHRYALVRTEAHAVAMLRQIAEREFAADTPLWVLAFHSGDEDGARRVLDAVRSVRRIVREEVIPLTPALGAHAGPGMTGFAALPVSP
jgi:DegV family protein with EDD domain